LVSALIALAICLRPRRGCRRAERSDRPATADTAARLLSSFSGEPRAIDELWQNLAHVCAGDVSY
jgi:hypothetical protein